MNSFNFQIDHLFTFMRTHSEFAKGNIGKLGFRGSEKKQELWIRLCTELNYIGPLQKNAEDWMKVKNTYAY